MSDIRDDVARAEGWRRNGSLGNPCAWLSKETWTKGDPGNDGEVLGDEMHPIRPLDSDACLGYALRRIRELGWDWYKVPEEGSLAYPPLHVEAHLMARKVIGHHTVEVTAEATGNDASDALHLLLAVLAATKPAARADEGRGG